MEQPDSDDVLIAAVKQGDAFAFETLMRRYWAVVHRQVRLSRLAHAEAVDDISQDVFVRVYRFIGTFRGEASFRSWLVRLAINETLTHGGMRTRQRNIWCDSGEGTKNSVVDTFPDPIQFDNQYERREVIYKAFAELPHELRTVVLLRYVQEMKYEEIARILQCPLG